ncbi:hypothetical protein D5085_11755 [Ectothiorhodospiraceae bacterium BW-2]|nr:hypothetical protein D5085_11755 [Ectothiorhodospiraceae bacterium BW-2]
MQVDVSELSCKRAKMPHEIFLINLITNHILLFVGLLGMAKTVPAVMAVTPVISLLVISYLLLRNRQIQGSERDWFVRCHWQLGVRRSLFFVAMLLLMTVVVAAIVSSVGWDFNALRPGHFALLGLGVLPTMLSVLVLIVMESDAIHQAKQGKLPKWLWERNPDSAIVVLAE